jgi:hypothetical protein
MDQQLLATLSWWDALLEPEQQQAARDVLTYLPKGFSFLRIFGYELGSQRHNVAVYAWKCLAFSLIPGGMVTLGYDPNVAIPTPEQRQNWEEETQEDVGGRSLDEFLHTWPHLTPLREVTIEPFLMQQIPTRLGPARSNSFRSEECVITQHDVLALAQEDGFRLPMSDEWEHACAAGSRTLFRWGNQCPVENDPDMTCDWQWHRWPTAFGVLMSSDPYDNEFCQEQYIRRGGDGGIAAHSGAGNFASWLSLASAYISRQSPQLAYPTSSEMLRRVLPLKNL